MPNALTLGDMSPRLRKVVGRESPRVTSTEEPDGGNLLVRIWRGAGVGNLPAYSTTLFCHSPVGHAPLGRRRHRPIPGQNGTPGNRQWSSAGWQRRSRGAAARGRSERLLKRRHFLRGGLVLEELIKQ